MVIRIHRNITFQRYLNINYLIITWNDNTGRTLLHMSIIKANHIAIGRFVDDTN